MNNVILSGRLTKDPELKFSQTGKKYLKFNLAVDKETKEEGTYFINCVAFQKTAEFISNYFSKGRKILINGKIQTHQYEVDGKKYNNYVIAVLRVEFADSKKEENKAKEFEEEMMDSGFDEEFPF
ncbi:MAG: single-stranded DNA-binding protein [Fusobacterium gastrosuis]|uniref:single-stranded DNA-binding protein n=1 Tax=Fusobacterium gastrosuis TaxID=1755100 RepID=UPI0029765494|nr:single-stranded DNA-binding protein [Fusobacteriaceae bacterium]MDY4011016.1 single-stranded DNA-binding protein [Fusobacterium gastrosuis]MDY5713532.1 single-stranded DNA-binding protein [Fusobacterium gastrosuis]